MWSVKNEKKILDISKVGTDFRTTSQNGLILICPRKNLWDWIPEQMWLRSIVVDDNGYIISSGWPKFGNYGEFKEDTDILNSALKDGVVRFTHKHDGSLAIRYCFNNEVIFRTRGTLFGGIEQDGEPSYGDKFREVATKKYPILLDSNFYPDRSLLFEYVAPSNFVVIRYKEEDLIFLGYVTNNLEIGEWEDVELIAKTNNFNLVEIYNLPRDPVKLLEEIKNWKDEGVVVRCNNDQTFVKVKSTYYLANHRLKYSMKYETMVEFAERSEIKSEEELIEFLKGCDYDWEIIDAAKEFYYRYVAVKELVNKSFNIAEKIFNEFNNNHTDRSNERNRKKEFALSLTEKGHPEIEEKLWKFIRPMAFSIYDNRKDKLNNMFKKIIITEGA